MRRYDELSKDQEPLLPRQFCSDCIIATRGYDFREGQWAAMFRTVSLGGERDRQHVVLEAFAQRNLVDLAGCCMRDIVDEGDIVR